MKEGGYVIGCDPGLKGGLAVLQVDGAASVIDAVTRMPTCKVRGRDEVDAMALHAWLDRFRVYVGLIVMEQVSAMPKQGVTSSFRFGQTYGALQALLQVVYPSAQMELVTPAVWKRGMGLGKDKRASLDAAARLWPAEFRGKPLAHDGPAEAALLAHWWINRRRAS